MTYDRSEVRRVLRQPRQGSAREASAADNARFFRQAAVDQGRLMGDPLWSVYQQMLQGAWEKAQDARAALTQKLAAPGILSGDQLHAIRYEIAHLDGVMAAFDAAVSLPRQLLENAENAAKSWEKTAEVIAGVANVENA